MFYPDPQQCLGWSFAGVTSRLCHLPGGPQAPHGASALRILHSRAGAWGDLGWALGQWQEKPLARGVLGSQPVGAAVAGCRSRLR